MSNFCDRIQSGPDNWLGLMRYALTINLCSEMNLMSTRVPVTVIGSPSHGPTTQKTITLPSSTAALTEATSNAGDSADSADFDCCCAGVYASATGAWPRPIARGPTRAATPALASRSFFARFNLCPVRFVRITSILLLRLAPVTPDTQSSGDST